VPFQIYRTEAAGILSPTSGFIAQAGFTHSLSPARNCTFGCSYCYVPTMGIYGGLKPDDWKNWGHFTTFKSNAPELLRKSLRPSQAIYCSPLVDPYQPAEQTEAAMPPLLDALIDRPPRVFALQTRGPLVLRDIARLQLLAQRTTVRVSFSISTDLETVRRWYEPHCAPIHERLGIVRSLRATGIAAYATLAPLLPCNPETLIDLALDASERDIIADPFHVRAVKKHGATTRDAALTISRVRGFAEWHDPAFQTAVTGRMRRRAEAAGRRFATGTEGFAWLAQDDSEIHHDGNCNRQRNTRTPGN
jgi:DNA repair photolyase